MDNEEIEIESVFLLKVDGLKQELSSRNLPTKGTKAELQERLLNFVTTRNNQISESILDEEATTEDDELKIDESIVNLDTPTILDDELNPKVFNIDSVTTPVSETDESKKDILEETVNTKESADDKEKKTDTKVVTPIKPSVKTIVSSSSKDRIENRSKRFGAPVSEEEKKRIRLEKFGGAAAVKSSDKKGLIAQVKGDLPDSDKIKSRQARFGVVESTKNSTPTNDKLKLRQDRFVDDRIKKRQERFGVV